MEKVEFTNKITTLVREYQNSPEYIRPKIEKQRISWHFVGWWALSLGFHISLKHINLEIHLPFGFIKISWKGETITYYDVSIQM